MIPNNLKSGDVVLTSGKSLLAKSIQKFQKSKWNHCGFIWIFYGTTYVIESVENGVGITKLSDYIQSNTELLFLRPSFDVKEDILGAIILPEIGKIQYNKWNLIVAQPLLIISNGLFDLSSTDASHMICSSFVSKALHDYLDIIDEDNKSLWFDNWAAEKPSDLLKCPYLKILQ